MSETTDTGDLPVIDRDEAAFEDSRSTREQRREEKSVQRLLKQRHEDRSKIDALERQLAEYQAAQSKGRVAAFDADLSDAEREARDAIAEGDAERAAKAQRRMAELAADRKAAQFEAESTPGPKAARMAPEVEDWIERNSWFKPNAADAKTKLALLAHQEAVEIEGFAANSPEYFRHIESRVEGKFPGTVARDDDDDEAEAAPPPRKVATGPAPVSARATPGRAAAVPTRIRATQDQINAAQMLGMPLNEYMAEAVKLQSAGRLNGGRR